MSVLASAATSAAFCTTTVLGKSPGRVRSAQFGAAPTCCERIAPVTASAPHSIHSRLGRIVILPLFVLHKKTYNETSCQYRHSNRNGLTHRRSVCFVVQNKCLAETFSARSNRS